LNFGLADILLKKILSCAAFKFFVSRNLKFNRRVKFIFKKVAAEIGYETPFFLERLPWAESTKNQSDNYTRTERCNFCGLYFCVSI